MTDQTAFLLQIGAGVAAGLLIGLFVRAVRDDLPAAIMLAGVVSAAIVGTIALVITGMTSTLVIGLLYSFAIGAACAFPVLLLFRLLGERD